MKKIFKSLKIGLDQMPPLYTTLIPSTLSALLFIVTLRINRLCSLEKEFNCHKLSMKEWFIKRDYSDAVILKEMTKVRLCKQGEKSKAVEKGVPFVVTYHPLLNKVTSNKMFFFQGL